MRTIIALAIVAYSVPGLAQGLKPSGPIWEQSKRLDCTVTINNRERKVLLDFNARTMCLADDLGTCPAKSGATFGRVSIDDKGLSTTAKTPEDDWIHLWLTKDGSLFRMFGSTGRGPDSKDFRFDGSCKLAA